MPTPVSALIHAATLVILKKFNLLLPLKNVNFLVNNSLYAGKTLKKIYLYLINIKNINYNTYKKILNNYNFIMKVNQQVILKINLLIGTRSTSETTRELSLNTFNFEDYKKEYNLKIDEKFLEWFIGFTEGDGSMSISIRSNNNKKELKFDITQTLSDVQVLYYIKKKLGFGKVYLRPESDRNVGFFYVTGKENFRKLITIFNGNICSDYKFLHFKKWLECYNEIYKDNIILINKINTPNINDNWISGFTDAEGSFIGRLRNTKKSQVKTYPNLIFQITQKDKIILEKIRFAFFGNKNLWIKYDKSWNGYRFSLESISNLNYIASYFNKFPLKTKKHITFLVWRNILKIMVLKKHLDPKNLNTLRNMISKLNK